MENTAANGTGKSGRLAWFLLVSISIIFANYWLTRHTPALLIGKAGGPPAWPVLVDTLLVIPLIYLFMFRRNGRRVWIGAVMMAGLGAFAANSILPEQPGPWLDHLKLMRYGLGGVLALVEFSLILGVMHVVYKSYQGNQDVEAAIESGFRSKFGDSTIARLLAFEARMWFYALFAPRNTAVGSIAEERFSYHLKDGHASNQQGFIVLILIELPILHVMLTLFWSNLVAWVVSLLTVWGLCFLIGEYRAGSRRQISMDDANVHVRFGLLPALQIPLAQIDQAQRSIVSVGRRTPGAARFCESGNPNVVIHLKQPMSVPGLFGNLRMIDRVFLGLDQPQAFVDRLGSRLAAAGQK